MTRNIISLIAVVLVSMLQVPISAQMPVSKEASIIDVASLSEVYIEGIGVYKSGEKSRRKRKKDVKKNGQKLAMLDAKKAAIYYVIFNGTDPLVSDPEELERFNKISEGFFSDDTINEVVVYTEPRPHKVVSLEKGEGIKVYLNMKLNVAYLRQVLEENLVIFSKEELIEELGYPQIMVIPRVKSGESPIDELNKDPMKQHGAGVIESFLTFKQYDVIVPDQLETMAELTKKIKTIKKAQKDAIYELALKVGADIYLDFSIGQAKSAYKTDQVSVTIRAYETTTSRLLATETGYSKPRIGEQYVSIEEAILSALMSVSQRLLNYWEDDIYKGAQYKVIVQLDNSTMSEEKYENVVDDLLNTMNDVAQNVKENVSTETTFDMTLWCNHKQITSSRDLYKAIKENFNKKQKQLSIKLINRNRKLVLLEIK